MQKTKTKLSFSQIITILGKAFKVSIKAKSKISFFVGIIGFGMAYIPVISSNVLKNFSNEIQNVYNKDNYILHTTFILFAILALLFILQVVYNFFRDYSLANDSLRTHRYIRESILKCSCTAEYRYIENYDNFKEKIAFADSYAGVRVANSMQSIIIWLQNLITFIGISYALIQVNVWIFIILIVTCIPAVIFSYLQKDESYRSSTKWMKEGTMVIHYFFICAGEDAMNEVRHWGLIDFLKMRWKNISHNYIEKKNKITRKHVLYNSIADVLRNIVYIAVLLITVFEIYKNPVLGIGTFMLVFTLSSQLQDVTAQLFIKVAEFYSDINYMKDFFDLEKLSNDDVDNNAKPYSTGNISFENVSFTYPNSKDAVLKNINVTIKDGEKIAIVGENGSGKTTFVNLLCGMYKPDKGQIKINDNDIFKNITATRRSISIVFQDFGRYQVSIKENITVSNTFREVDEDEIYELAKKTDLYDYIINQPNKLEEEIGLFSDEGNNLSGGQWQKLALTRALYRNNAKIMVLDEPTAALDPIAETKLYKNFTDLTKDKTTILISHRLGIASLVDRVLVFKDGAIIENGSHNELLNNNGYYAKMYYSQARWYESELKGEE